MTFHVRSRTFLLRWRPCQDLFKSVVVFHGKRVQSLFTIERLKRTHGEKFTRGNYAEKLFQTNVANRQRVNFLIT